MKKNLREATKFFKEEQGFQRLFRQFIEKYKGIGRIGGRVKLINLTEAEQEAFSLFFRKDYFKHQSVAISMAQFEAALAKTKFTGVALKDLLEEFLGTEILTKEEEKELYARDMRLFFQGLLEKYPHPYCQRWLNNILKKGQGTRGIYNTYNQTPKLLKKQLEQILAAISRLPEQGYERISLFAHRITKNPHGFDNDTEEGRLLLSALQWIRKSEGEGYEYITSPSAEEVTEILQYFRLVRDDLQNFATCFGILGFRDGYGEPVPQWKEAWYDQAVLNVPLREVIRADKVMSAPYFFNSTDNNIVFAVENSGVFSALLDAFKDTGKPLPAMICTHGQFRLATLILLDRLVESGTTIYYSGDFDPEGLQMTQKLMQRYPKKVIPWRYQVEDYEGAISSIKISPVRLKKLTSINFPELIPVAKKIYERGKAGYQEELINSLMEDLQKHKVSRKLSPKYRMV